MPAWLKRWWAGFLFAAIVLFLGGWFAIGNAVGIAHLRWHRCGDEPMLNPDPTCHGPMPGMNFWIVGLSLLGLAIVSGLLSMAGLAMHAWTWYRKRDDRSALQ